MANSISLTTDMTKLQLFFPDGALPQEFSLTGNGVYITSILGNVHVVAASSALTEGADEFSTAAVAQWNATFHENTNQLMMIGDDDIEPTFTGDVKKYGLSGGNTFNLRLNSAQTKLLIRTSK
ncbi:MAG: hypothetical protein AB8F94_08455 [Saprospiraceae bacterium]